MRQYFTYRLFPIPGGWWSPDRLLETCFTVMNLRYKLEIVKDDSIDGRRLGWIECDTQDEIDAVIEALAPFGVHLKTSLKCKEFADQITKKVTRWDGEMLKMAAVDPETMKEKEIEL